MKYTIRSYRWECNFDLIMQNSRKITWLVNTIECFYLQWDVIKI